MIARWVDSGAPMGTPKEHAGREGLPGRHNGICKGVWPSARYDHQVDRLSHAGVSQDQWWRPIVNLMSRIRSGFMASRCALALRRTQDHAPRLGHLLQDDPDARKYSDFGDSNGPASSQEAGTLMEWAVGKNYDLYRNNTGKLILPGAKIWWDIHYHAVGEDITITSSWALVVSQRSTPRTDLSDWFQSFH